MYKFCVYIHVCTQKKQRMYNIFCFGLFKLIWLSQDTVGSYPNAETLIIPRGYLRQLPWTWFSSNIVFECEGLGPVCLWPCSWPHVVPFSHLLHPYTTLEVPSSICTSSTKLSWGDLGCMYFSPLAIFDSMNTSSLARICWLVYMFMFKTLFKLMYLN